MATAAELMSYKGNAGLGSNPQIPVTDGRVLETTNQVLRDIGAREHQKNILRYQQQVRDRDDLLKALSSGEVKVGDVLERDMPIVRKALDKQTEAYKNWMRKGYGDIDGAIAYKKATQEANEAAVQAQARKAWNDKESERIAKEGIPKFAEARKATLDKTLGNFWGDIIPFQETSRLDLDPIEKMSEQFTEEFIDPNKKFYKGKRSYFSFDNTKRNASAYSLEPSGLHNLQMLQQAFDEMAPVELATKVKGINKELERYNTERNLTAGQSDYAPPIQVVQMPNGKWAIKDAPDDLAAKIALAGQTKFKSESFEPDKQALDLAELQERGRHNRAMEAVDRGKLAIDWAKFNYAKDEDKFGAETVLNEAKDIISKGEEAVVEAGGKKIKVLRIADPTLLKTFGNVDKEGNVSNVPDAIEYNRDKDQVKLVYYRDDKTESGKNFIEKEVSLDQRTWLKEIAKRSFPNKDIGKVNTLVDAILNDSGNSLYKLTQKQPSPSSNAGKTYRVNGYDYTDKEIEDAAKQLGMTKDAYMKKYKIK